MSNLSARELLLAARLDRLSRAYPRAISQSDPIRFPAAYDRPDDREVAGWIASAFAYGRVETILASVGRVLAALGPHPARAVDSISDFPRFAREDLAGFRHRFHSAADASALLYAIASVRAEAGSVRKFFEDRQRREDADAGAMLSRAVVRVLNLDWRPAVGRRSLSATSPVRFFFPDPASGSACKRWNLYLRWMVRRDALDFGLWEGITPSRLVVPTDTHVHRVARRLNLTRRKSADWKTAREITGIFTEVVVAPDATDEAKAIFVAKKNLRLLTTGGLPDPRANGLTFRSLAGGFLVQSRDNAVVDDLELKLVTKRKPTEQELADLKFAFKVAKHVKSNAIVYAKGGATVGIGAGQMSRVDSARIGASKSLEATNAAGVAEPLAKGSVVASDAFFPFADGLLAAAEAGATAVIQPGGSMRDAEVIKAADDADLAMVFTGVRHFRH